MDGEMGSPVRYLWLLRHGKAAPGAPGGGPDRERPLTARGRGDASALGSRLAGEIPPLGLSGVPVPEAAICSAAVRTRQTAELVIEAMHGRLPLDSQRSLYDAGTAVLLRYVREIDEGVRSAMVVGHNPSIARLAWELLGSAEAASGAGRPDREGGELGGSGDRAALEAHGFPTCALAVLALHVGAWEDAVHGCASLAGVFKPPY